MRRKTKPPPIGRQIAEARKAAGLTQIELAARIGQQQSNLSAIERGARTPDVPTLCRIAGALGLSLLVEADGARLIDPAEIAGG